MAKEQHKVWEERISKAKAVRDEWKELFRVDLARDFFEGKQNINGWVKGEWIQINKVYSHLKSKLPSLYSIDPYFYVKAKKSYNPIKNVENPTEDPELIEFTRKGKIRQDNLNYLKGELELKKKIRLAIQDAQFAFGVIKCRFSQDEVKNPQAGEPIVDEDGEQLTGEDGKGLVHPDTLPQNKRYIVSRIHPDCILFDEDAQELEDTWKFIAEEIKMSKSDAKKDPRFKGKSKIIDSIAGVSVDKQEKGRVKKAFDAITNRSVPKDDDEEIILMYEIYDLKQKQWLIIAEGADGFMKDPEALPPGVEDRPYEFLRFTLRDRSAYPIPPMSQGIEQQNEYNLSRSRILRHRKRFNRKYEVFAQGLEDPDINMSQLESDDDGVYIKKKMPGTVVEPIKDAPLDQMAYTELGLLTQDMNEVWSSSENARGVAAADSATEASIIEARQDVREGDEMAQVIDFTTGVARKLDQLVQVHMDTEEAVRVTGPQGEFWSQITPDAYEEIQGEYEYSVNVGASKPRLPDIERAQTVAFLSQVLIPFPHIMTMPRLMKQMAEMYHIEDEIILEELMDMGEKILSGMVQSPGNAGGSQPAENNPVAAVMGSAMGQLGGNNNGGGA